MEDVLISITWFLSTKMMIISNLQGKYGSRKGEVKGFAQIHRPPCCSFCLMLLTTLSSSVKWKPYIYQGSPCFPISLETLSFMGTMVTFRAQLPLSSHPPNSHSFPPSSQPVPLLLHVFFGVQVLCSHCSSVFMAVTAWPFPRTRHFMALLPVLCLSQCFCSFFC